MSYEFNINKDFVQLSTVNLNYLLNCEQRIIGVQASVDTPERLALQGGNWVGPMLTQEMADREIARLEKARKDIVRRLSKEEKAEHRAYVKASKPRELTAEEKAAVIKKLDENRDKESI